jgi:anti-anti-sigma factor
MDIRVNKTVGRDETRIALHGRFDAHEIEHFTQVTKAIHNHLCLDLEGVPFIDSSGLSALVALYRHCGQRGLRLRIVRLQDPVWLILEITRLLPVLPIEQDTEYLRNPGQLV